MKIDINLSPEPLLILAATMQVIYNTTAHTRRTKATLSIALDVAAKLDGKAANAKLKRNLFDAKKKVKVSLKFHEADMLELILIQHLGTVDEPYIRQQLQTIVNQLNQKLA